METIHTITILGFFIQLYIHKKVEEVTPENIYKYAKENRQTKNLNKHEIDNILYFLHVNCQLGLIKKTDGTIYYGLSGISHFDHYLGRL